MRLSASVAAIVLSAGWLVSPRAGAAGLQSGREKTVFAAALDSANKPVTDLTKADWSLREDNGDRPLSSATRATDPIDVIVLVDTTKWIQNYVSEIRTAIASFVRTLQSANPASSTAVMAFGGASTTLVDLGKSAEEVDKAIQRIYPDQSGTTVLLEALGDASKKLAKARSPRRTIVSVNIETSPEASSVQPQTVASAVIAAGASLWAVSFRDASSTNSAQNRDIILNNLTIQTGGARLTVTASTAIETALKQIADVLLAQYALTYSRPEGASPKTLAVSLTRPAMRVLAPRIPPR